MKLGMTARICIFIILTNLVCSCNQAPNIAKLDLSQTMYLWAYKAHTQEHCVLSSDQKLKFQVLLEQRPLKWHKDFATYSPELEIKADGFGFTLSGNSLIISMEEGQFKSTIDREYFSFLKCQ